MANKKITDLPTASTPDGSEYIELVQGGINKKSTILSIGSGNWRGAYDLSGNAYPSAGGTGVSGIPAPGNEWYVSVPGTLDIYGIGVAPVEYGALLKYLGGTVSSASSWKVTQ
jgi:hypothetical protein